MLPALLLLLQSTPTRITMSAPHPGEKAAREAFARLAPQDRRDLVEWFGYESARLRTFQAELVRHVLGTLERKPDAWPEEQPAAHFSSKEHTPENDIPRRVLRAHDPRVERARRRLLGRLPAPRVESAWRYDHGAATLVRGADWKDPARVFRNGLAGFPPDLDLATALVERALDDGSQRAALAAFGHAYTDRDGGVYPGITLYDAWSSGLEIEMPDVDALGIVHTLLGDHTTWKAPVPASQHKRLYARVGELFAPAHLHRALRRALAQTYLEGDARLGDGYAGYLDNFHALWEEHRSDPASLAPRLPAPEGRMAFLDAWVKTCFERGEVFQAGKRRREVLEQDRAETRALLLRLLGEFRPREKDG